jgi:hypothetical protein
MGKYSRSGPCKKAPTSADQWRATRDNAAKFGLDLAGIELRNYPYGHLEQCPISGDFCLS